jgi:hypothetical protein
MTKRDRARVAHHPEPNALPIPLEATLPRNGRPEGPSVT